MIVANIVVITAIMTMTVTVVVLVVLSSPHPPPQTHQSLMEPGALNTLAENPKSFRVPGLGVGATKPQRVFGLGYGFSFRVVEREPTPSLDPSVIQ